MTRGFTRGGRRPLLRLMLLHLLLALAQPAHGQRVYWAEPEVLEPSGVRFLQAASGGELVVTAWQEMVGEESFLSLRSTRDFQTWTENGRFAGPFRQESQETPLFSLAMDEAGRIYLAVIASEGRIILMVSEDGGRSFQTSELETPFKMIAPRLFVREGFSGLYLFTVRSTIDSLTIYYTDLEVSDFGAGRSSAALRPFIREESLKLSFLPHYAGFRGREYVVFQYQPGRAQRYQIYMKVSDPLGRFDPAEQPVALTDFAEQREEGPASAAQFDNQRPFLEALPDRLALAWERSYQGGPYQIYYMELGADGEPLDPGPAGIQGYRVTEGPYNCLAPRVFTFRGRVHLVWFDNRRGDNHVILAEKRGNRWEERDLSREVAGVSIYPWPILARDYLSIFWENQAAGRSRLISLAPDQRVTPPRLAALTFVPGRPTRTDRASVRWNVPPDTSGIEGFAYLWSQDPAELPPRVLMAGPEDTSVTERIQEEGTWYFTLAAKDFAGNWSEPARLEFVRDVTPPGPVELADLPEDEKGFLPSNNPELEWSPPEGEPVAGYTYELVRLDHRLAAAVPDETPAITPPGQVLTQSSSKRYYNIDNGVWAFGVAAVDIAGNRGPVRTVVFRCNKYVPVTIVNSVTADEDQLGRVALKVFGRGFTEDGIVERVILDRDGEQPYDYTFSRSGGDFQVQSNRLVEGPLLERFDEGTYRVGLDHSKRGVTFSRITLSLSPLGTVKLGDYSGRTTLSWTTGRRPSVFISLNALIVGFVMLFLLLVLGASSAKLVSVAREGREIRSEILAVVSSRETVQRREAKMKELKKQGLGLRAKYTMLIALLVFLVVLLVSIPLGFYTIQSQGRTLAFGLRDRARVLAGSVATGSHDGLIDQDVLPLRRQINQIAAMPEAEYATITGIRPRGSQTPGQGEEYVWASNDENITGKLVEPPAGGEPYDAGRSVIRDAVSPRVPELAERLNGRARAEVSQMASPLEGVLAAYRSLAGRTDERSRVRFEELGIVIGALRARINEALSRIAAQVSAEPEFDYRSLQSFYVFYRPIVYYTPGEDIYFRGLVRLGVSAGSILKEIGDSRLILVRNTGLIALAAVALGVLGALILASITISPIKKLVAAVERIRDTEDKEQLKDHHVDIKQKDELRILADTIEDMTQGLVKAAIANKDLMVGKDVQKMFIPLRVDEQGNKGTVGGEENQDVEIFGFYEGAKGVSGDYFDYRKLDDRHYAVIKCDVAGKGVPASLIMVEVATIFSTHFRSWDPNKPNLRIDRLAYTINDMLEERGFKGRFAALILCLLDVKTGVVYLCNAGDNVVHQYSSRRGRMIQKTLPESPAAGVFPSMLVEMQSGFKMVKDRLEKSDTLFLFTDGIEEAKRTFRDSEYNVIACQEEGLEPDAQHGDTHAKGATNEELGIPRIQSIINAVYSKGTYRLHRYHAPDPDEELTFDFSGCRATVEEAVLAMVSVEKVFRMYQPPTAGPGDIIQVHRRIEEFLSSHFDQYSLYFSHRIEREDEADIVSFSHLREDEQYDDLTILAIRKG